MFSPAQDLGGPEVLDNSLPDVAISCMAFDSVSFVTYFGNFNTI